MLCAEDVSEVRLSCRCDEELWPDLTGLVDVFGEDEDSSVDSVLHGDDLALAVAEREVVVEEPATELVGSHVLVGLRQDLAEGTGVRSPSAVSMALPRAATGRWASISASALARAARSSLRRISALIMMSGSASMSSMVAGVAPQIVGYVRRADAISIQASSHIPSVGNSQDAADIIEDKPGFSLFVCHDADVVAEVVEDGDVVHQLFSFMEA